MEGERIGELSECESDKNSSKENPQTLILSSGREVIEDKVLFDNKADGQSSESLFTDEVKTGVNSVEACSNVTPSISCPEETSVILQCETRQIPTEDGVKERVKAEDSVEHGKDVKRDGPEGNSLCAFTKCQDDDSCTEDSESDSDTSEQSDSESSESESSSSKEKTASEDSTTSDEQEENSKKPIKPRAGVEMKEERKKQNKKKDGLYKGELDLEDLPPIEDLHITVPEEQCEPLGTVCSIVNQLVVIESLPNKPALNLDSLLFKKYGECLGEIFDVFGPVKRPFYSLRFNSRQEITEKGIEVGQTVYCAPQTPHTKYVFVYQLMKQKGSDASWKHNYEIPPNMVDYSDDEEERKAKRKNHQKARARPNKQWSHQDCPEKKRAPSSHQSNNYSQHNVNEWYRARISELNQFNRLDPTECNRRYLGERSCNRSRNNGWQESAGRNADEYPSAPPALLRPPTPLSWNPPPAVPLMGVPHNNCTPVFPPPFVPPGCGGFSSPPPFTHHRPYDRLNSPVHFSNPVPPLADRPPPPRFYCDGPRPNFLFQRNNTGRSPFPPDANNFPPF